MLHSFTNKRRSFAPLLFVYLLSLAGCNNVGPFVEPVDPGGIPEGPGLFSGENGTLYQSKNSDVSSEAISEESSGAAEFKEFRDYQQWLKEGRNSDEYKEFQEWMRYKKWKSGQ